MDSLPSYHIHFSQSLSELIVCTDRVLTWLSSLTLHFRTLVRPLPVPPCPLSGLPLALLSVFLRQNHAPQAGLKCTVKSNVTLNLILLPPALQSWDHWHRTTMPGFLVLGMGPRPLRFLGKLSTMGTTFPMPKHNPRPTHTRKFWALNPGLLHTFCSGLTYFS